MNTIKTKIMNTIKTKVSNFIKNKDVKNMYKWSAFVGCCVGGTTASIYQIDNIRNNYKIKEYNLFVKPFITVYYGITIIAHTAIGYSLGGLTVMTAPISIPIIYEYISYEDELRKIFKIESE